MFKVQNIGFKEVSDMSWISRKRNLKLGLVGLVLLIIITGGGARHGVIAIEDTYERIKVFTEVLSLVQSYYVEEVNSKDLIYGALKGMLEALDPHSAFMPPDMYKEMQLETQGAFGGLGIEITVRDRQLTVVAPIEGTPADRAGIQAGDRILKIDGKPAKDMTLMEAVKKMRGPKGTRVTITIWREDFTEPRDITLIRDIIEVKSVKSKDLGDGIGYIRIVSFQERTGKDLEKALDILEEKGMKALVLDLRNNPGGLLEQAVEVADKFLEKGRLIVYTQGRTKNQDIRKIAERKDRHPDYPMVVLINGGSASASEIVAGALQDWKKAVILGTQSFGKGSVQTVIPLSDGSGLRLTTARYYTPKGKSIHGMGIIPDIIVEPPKPSVMAKPLEPGHPPKELIRRQERKISEEEGEGPEIKKEDDLRSDVQLQRAVEILKASRILDRGGPQKEG